MCECGHSVETHDLMTRRCRNVDCDCRHMKFGFETNKKAQPMPHSFSDLEATIRAVANERPDYRYAPPDRRYETAAGSYLPDDVDLLDGSTRHRDGCIMGQAFTRLGWLNDLVGHDGQAPIDEVYRTAEKALSWLHEIQTEQDNGDTWEEALMKADEASHTWGGDDDIRCGRCDVRIGSRAADNKICPAVLEDAARWEAR